VPAQRVIRRFHRTTFRTKLILTYVFLIFIPVVLVLYMNSVQLYNQTKNDYEQILEQLNERTNVTVDGFFNNLTRTSFFYSTEDRLLGIMSKTKPQAALQYNADANYMQTAIAQFILMNGNISEISVLAPNGSVYSSKFDNTSNINIMDVIDKIGRHRLVNSNYVVSVAESAKTDDRSGPSVSIVRYLSDLNVSNNMYGYAKIDVNFKSIQHMLGGIADSNTTLGTVVFADDYMLYNSDARMKGLTKEQMKAMRAAFSELRAGGHHVGQLKWGDRLYQVSGSVNPSTGWEIVHFIPTDQMRHTFLQNVMNYALFSVIALMAAFLLAYFFSSYFVDPIIRLSKAMKLIDSGYLHSVIPRSGREDEIGRLLNSYHAMIERLNKSREAEIVSGQLQKKAELKMLQAQINPHFLYNTLNTIHAISELHRVEDISTMTKSLSGMYRYNIKYGDEVTIEKEMEQVDNYIKIQQIRFLNRFTVEYDISPDTLHCKILKFLIQPIVENSFYHGLEPKGGTGVLKLGIRRLGHTLIIRIEDNGVGMSEAKIDELTAMFQERNVPSDTEEGRHFGLFNVYSRIKHFYGAGYSMKVSGAEHIGTTIEMHIPVNEETDIHENINSGR